MSVSKPCLAFFIFVLVLLVMALTFKIHLIFTLIQPCGVSNITAQHCGDRIGIVNCSVELENQKRSREQSRQLDGTVYDSVAYDNCQFDIGEAESVVEVNS